MLAILSVSVRMTSLALQRAPSCTVPGSSTPCSCHTVSSMAGFPLEIAMCCGSGIFLIGLEMDDAMQ